MQKKVTPKIIEEVGFDFDWDEKLVWQLDVPTTELPMSDLDWHFNVPFWWENGGYYNLKPSEVLAHPDQHQEEYQRTLQADLSHPIDIMMWRGRWLILDGLHRLLKLQIKGATEIAVRQIPTDAIPLIKKKQSRTPD